MISLLLAIRTESEANLHEHRMKKARRTKMQRTVIKSYLGRVKLDFGLWDSNRSYIVTLTRIAPRSLDDDNLARALKATRDGVADALGTDDSTRSKLKWRYAQEKGPPKKYAVRIQIEIAGNGEEGDVLESSTCR
jgi:hypothetical protein